MRIRTIKPEFWRSQDVTDLPWNTRLIFVGLWSYVDDNGVGRDNEKLITADLFALEDDPRETLARVSEALSVLENKGQITRYATDGRAFLHITNWERHQKIDKPGKPRYPLPTCANTVPRVSVATPSRESRENLAPGTGEQGNRGTGKRTSSSEVADATPRRDDVERICKALADKIEANGSKRPTITERWRNSARLLLDRDNHTEDQILRAIAWCQADEFWRSNVLSMPKLREKYDALRLAAQRTPKNGTAPSSSNRPGYVMAEPPRDIVDDPDAVAAFHRANRDAWNAQVSA